MSRMSPPRSYTDREPPFAAGPPRRKRRRSRRDRLIELRQALRPHHAVLAASILIEIGLLIIALVPQNTWAGLGYPSGPIPDFLEPAAAGLFYILPTLTGALCRKWMAAVVLATLPAWLDLCVFAVAAATHIGPFYLVTDPHAVSTVGTLELFAVLGALGWFARISLLGVLKQRRGSR